MASSCSSVVDLGSAAELDESTSKLFFSDSSAPGSGSSVSWPVASEIESTLTRRNSLVAQCSKYRVPSELTPFCSQHLGGLRACTPPPVGSNKMCVYSNALDAGLRFPLHDFYIKVLRHYQLAPSQLAPNSWSYLAAFVLLCQDAGVEAPLVSAFRYFFTICAHRHEGKPTGWHHFQPNHDVRRRLFTSTTNTLPSWSGWRSRFFFLDCPSGWKCQVEWGKPKRQDARRVQLTDTAIQKLKAKVEEIGCIDIKAFLDNRAMPVGDLAALAPLQSAVKAEAEVAGASAAAVGAAAENASTTTRKRSRLSPAAAISQPQPLPASPPPGLARISSTGGRSVHIPPPGLAPIIASSTGGSGMYTPPLGFPPTRTSSTGGSGVYTPTPQQQSLGDSTSAPRDVPGMRGRAQAVSIGGSSQVTPPALHTMWASDDSLQLLEALTKASEQEAMIAKLNQELQHMKTWNTQWQKELRDARANHVAEIDKLIVHLHAANDRNSHLNEEVVQLMGHLRTASVEVARLKTDRVEVAQLKAEHAAESAQLKEELAAEAKQLKEELAFDTEQLKNVGYEMGARDMVNLALNIYKHKGVINPDDLKVDLLYSHDQ